MVMHTNVQKSPGPHFAVVDSGTSMHILQYRLFTSNLSELCATLNSLDTPSYWGHKPDYYHTVIPNSSFRSSKTNPPASGSYLCYHHCRHTMVSIQSTTVSHHQDKPEELDTKIQIKASFTAGHA